jgi:hypothetical protein
MMAAKLTEETKIDKRVFMTQKNHVLPILKHICTKKATLHSDRHI